MLPFLTRGAMKSNLRAVLQPVSFQTVAELPRAQETRTSPWDVASIDPHGLPTDSGVRSHPKFKMGDAVNSSDCIIVHSFLTPVCYCLEVRCLVLNYIHFFIYVYSHVSQRTTLRG